MERQTNIGGTEPNESATPTATSKAAEETGKVFPRKAGQAHRYLVSGWRFARHLLEMVVGMAVLGLTLAVLGEPPGYANFLLRYGLIGAFMSAPMLAWMHHRGHSWKDGMEMTVAMLALVIPVEVSVAKYVPRLSEQSLMMLSHVAMIAGMVVQMVYCRDRYAHGHRP
jgi:hypothetical protein